MTRVQPYTLTIAIPPEGWRELQARLPSGAVIESADLIVSDLNARIHILYRGKRPDGTPHRRRSTHPMTLGKDSKASSTWLYSLFPPELPGSYAYRSALENWWPEAFRTSVRRAVAIRAKITDDLR